MRTCSNISVWSTRRSAVGVVGVLGHTSPGVLPFSERMCERFNRSVVPTGEMVRILESTGWACQHTEMEIPCRITAPVWGRFLRSKNWSIFGGV